MNRPKSYYYLSAVTGLFVCACALFVPRWRGGSLHAWQIQKIVGADPVTISFLVRFGVQDSDERPWDGSVSAIGGEIQSLRDWHPMSGDRITQNTWSFGTRREPNWDLDEKNSQQKIERERSPSPYLLTPGLIIYVNAAPGSVFRFQTVNGSFEVDYRELRERGRVTRLDGNIEVELSPSAQKLSADGYECDFPAVLADSRGTAWTAWVGYRNHANEVLIRHLEDGFWRQPVTLTDGPSDIFLVKLGRDKNGHVWAVWSAQVQGNFDLYARRFDGHAWSEVERLTDSPQPDIYHNLATDSLGNLWLAWQGFRDGQSDIFVRRYDGTKWSREERISTSPANDWEPVIATDGNGATYVAWDTYERGDYDIVMRRYAAGVWSDIIPVARTSKFEAHASIACDHKNRVWLAWNESGPRWGKDTGFVVKQEGTPLYQDRSIAIVAYDNGTWSYPAEDLNLSLPEGMQGHNDYPSIEIDGADRPWVFFRHRSLRRHDQFATYWERGLWAWNGTYLDGDRWATPIEIPFSQGHMDMRISLSRGQEGELYAAYATDNRNYSEYLFRTCDVYAARMPSGPKQAVSAKLLQRRSSALDSIPIHPSELAEDAMVKASTEVPLHPDEMGDIARIRNYRIQVAGRTYHIYRGDTHRHTEFSWDGNNDGSLQDVYRYALDAAALDFLGVSDHNDSGGPDNRPSGPDLEYVNWIEQQRADVFMLPQTFSPLYGYERSVRYPNGHRNVLFAKRGTPTLPITRNEWDARSGAKRLYDYLKLNNGISIPHSPATGMGTDWRDNDPEVEPLVEIYQGDRVSAEYEGAPRAAYSTRPATQPGGLKAAGYVWNAWGTRGYKLGVQASSDHLSTHISYACTLATDLSREGLLDAMRLRHSYGATDNIILDYRLRTDGKEYLQGDVVTVSRPFKLTLRVIGTAPIRQLDVIKDRTFLYDRQMVGQDVSIEFVDNEIVPGEHYYYVRVIQVDDQIAWSSPIWVKRP